MSMEIQANHMHLGLTRPNAAETARAATLRTSSLLPETHGSQLNTGLAIDRRQYLDGPIPKIGPDLPDAPPETLGQTLAHEVVRRIEARNVGSDQSEDPHGLQLALGQSMDWVRDRFGDDAAAAASGMVLSATASGVDEDSLSDGLLDALRFIDRNYGMAAGDAAIAKFNVSLNGAINEYFDNGRAELFFATDSPPAADVSPTQDLNARFFMRSAQEVEPQAKDASTPTEQLLETLKADLDKTAQTQNLATQLESELSPARFANALDAYMNPAAANQPQLTSMTV